MKKPPIPVVSCARAIFYESGVNEKGGVSFYYRDKKCFVFSYNSSYVNIESLSMILSLEGKAMGRYARACGYFATAACLLFSGWQARQAEAATDLGDVCWTTEAGKLWRATVSQTGIGKFTYIGTFIDADEVAYAIIGHIETVSGTLIGSFSGAKTTPTHLNTGIFLLTLNPTTGGGAAEGIRHRYERSTGSVSTEYRTNTLTPTRCP